VNSSCSARPPPVSLTVAVLERGHGSLAQPALLLGPDGAELAHRAVGAAVQIWVSALTAQQRAPADVTRVLDAGGGRPNRLGAHGPFLGWLGDEDQQRAEDERASRDGLRAVQGALMDALLALPPEASDGFDFHRGAGKRRPRPAAQSEPAEASPADGQAILLAATGNEEASEGQRQFFEYAGPLFSVMISPTSSVIEVGGSRALRATARRRASSPVKRPKGWRSIRGAASHTSAM